MHILYTYIYAYIHMHTHTCTHIPICICTYTHNCACVYELLSVNGNWDGKAVQNPKGYAITCYKHIQHFFCY